MRGEVLTFVLPAILAGLLGLFPAQAELSEYVPRLRVMFLGAVGLGYLGIAVFLFRKTAGWKRWVALVWSLAVVRVSYTLIISTAVLMAGWAAWLARLIGDQSLVLPIHYATACFAGALTGTIAIAAVSAGTNLKRVGWIVIALLFVGEGVLSFWLPEDRHPSPHPFADAPPAAAHGPEYLEVVEDTDHTPVTRIIAAAATIRHAMWPRSGWGGSVRKGLLMRARANPEMGILVRVNCLEAALLEARKLLDRQKAPGSGTADPQRRKQTDGDDSG